MISEATVALRAADKDLVSETLVVVGNGMAGRASVDDWRR